MISKLSGRITFANGAAARDVEVRVYDQDAPGKEDDDLTLTPGLTDDCGYFNLRYDPGRFLDFASLPVLGGVRVPDLLDIYAPYLRLRYIFDGQERVFNLPLIPFQSHYQLPEHFPVHFLPSNSGFAFENNFPPITLPFTVPGFPKLTRITSGYGLCGGMSAAAADFLLAGRAIPLRNDVPRMREKLYRYLFRRAMDSFKMGESVLRFAQWMALEDSGPHSTARLTLSEFDALREALDQHQLAPVGLVIAAGRDLKSIAREVWINHQVLAYGYTENMDGTVDVHVYDPNSPGRDDAFIRVTRIEMGAGEDGPLMGAACQPVNLRIFPLRVRGFFLMPYEPAEPPEDLE